jgi:nitrite reductase (NO-forming)
VPDHIANGMYGLILVEPEKGMPKVDREYYVMQSEFYTKGEFGDEGLQEYSPEKGAAEHPTYVVFNGKVGALQPPHALQANVGDTVRVYFGNIGPNLHQNSHLKGSTKKLREKRITLSRSRFSTWISYANKKRNLNKRSISDKDRLQR